MASREWLAKIWI
ncbi:unnamed protein product, partial [Rotaria sordida]